MSQTASRNNNNNNNNNNNRNIQNKDDIDNTDEQWRKKEIKIRESKKRYRR